MRWFRETLSHSFVFQFQQGSLGRYPIHFHLNKDVEGAAINWGKADQKMLRKVPQAEMEKYVQEGQFPAGSMGPKVDSMIQFFKATGNRGVICHLEDIEKAIAGQAGTEIIK